MDQIRFEAGVHPTTNGGIEQVLESWLEKGQPASFWNDAVSERISAYSPEYCVIDSLTNDFNQDMTLQDKVNVLSIAPAMPNVINGQDHFYTLAGDVLLGYEGAHNLKTMANRATGALITISAVGYGAKSLERYLYKREEQKRENDDIYELIQNQEGNKLTRRQFIGRFAIYGLTYAFLAPSIHSFSSSQEMQELARSMQDFVEPISLHHRSGDLDTFVDGRTALMIEKAKSLSKLTGTKRQIPIVLGATHSYRANEFMQNPAARKQAIFKYTSTLIDDYKKEINIDDASSNLANRFVINRITHSQLIKIYQPDYKDLLSDPIAEINRIVEHVDEIEHPELTAIFS